MTNSRRSWFWDSGEAAAAGSSPPPTSSFVRLTDLFAGHFVESGDGITGWLYTYASGDIFNAVAGASSLSLAADADGSFSIVFVGPNDNVPCALIRDVSAPGNYSQADYGVYAYNGFWTIITAGIPNQIPNLATVAVHTGDIARFTRTGDTLVCAISLDAGATWTDIQAWAGAITAQLWICINTNGGQTFGPITGVGLT